jgi:hypothetical protein
VRRPWSALVLAAGGLVLLVSLYLPWGATTVNIPNSGSELLHFFDQEESAWSVTAGTACAVVALYLVAAGVTLWIRAPHAIRIPISAPAMLAAYLALAIAIDTRATAENVLGEGPTVDFDYARGAYLGLAAGVLSIASAFALRRSALVRSRPPVVGLLGSGTAIALLIALLLPSERATLFSHATIEYRGISEPASVVVALAAAWLATMFWSNRAEAGWKRVLAATSAALFTLGAVTAASALFDRIYGAWIALGIAFVLVPLAILRCGRLRVGWVNRLAWRELALAAAPLLFVTSLFLPWRKQCFLPSFAADPRAGHCESVNAWTLNGTAAAALAVGLLVVVLGQRRGWVHPFALSAGVTLFAAAAAIELARGSTRGAPIELVYGAVIGLACAAAGVVLALATVRFGRLNQGHLLKSAIPVALCLAYLAIVVIPPLSEPSVDRPTLFFAPTSWLTVAGVVVAILLAGSWVDECAERGWLVVLPLCMLALTVVDLIRLRENLAWGAAVVVGICALLFGLGRIEQRGGFQNFRLPELFRIDRI